MFDITVETRLPVDAERVWAAIGSFEALADWHPAIAACTSEDHGDVRRLTLAEGGEVVEWLVERDDRRMNYTYLLEDPGPLPVQRYMANLKVEPEGRSKTHVMWSGQFEPHGNTDQAQQLVTDIFDQGLDNLQTLFDR